MRGSRWLWGILGLVACSKPPPPSAVDEAGSPSASIAPATTVPFASAAASASAPPAASAEGREPGRDSAPRAPAAPVFRARSDPKRGEVLAIPAGTLVMGSAPGDEGRDPTVEPVQLKLAMSAFGMDALPYPNDPAAPPKINVTRSDAERLCAERHARLCTEAEWEYACKGPASDPYATGLAWDPACSKEPSTCPSGFGVRALGALREWTSGEVLTAAGAGAAAVRGGGALPKGKEAKPPPAGAGAGRGERGLLRCAHRGRAAEAQAQDLGFRCCTGAPNAHRVPAPVAKPAFRKTKLDAAAVQGMVAAAPELSRLTGEVKLYDAGEASWLARSEKPHDAVVFSTAPVLYSPEPGLELLVATGHTKNASFVLAFYVMPDETYRAASSFVMQGDLAPVALGFDPNTRRLYWTSCWQCPGDTGEIVVQPDHRVMIVQL